MARLEQFLRALIAASPRQPARFSAMRARLHRWTRTPKGASSGGYGLAMVFALMLILVTVITTMLWTR